MSLIKKQKLILTFLVLFGVLFGNIAYQKALASEELNVTATVDRNTMRVGDTFTFSISVSSGSSVSIGEPQLPSLSPFEVIQRWSGSETRSVYSGGQFQVLRTQGYNYMLVATQEGEFTLGAAEVVVSGSSYFTKPIRITVSEGAPPPPSGQQAGPPVPSQPQSDPFRDADELFNQLLQRRMGARPDTRSRAFGNVDPQEAYFIQVEVDKTTAYVGEPIMASWYLVTRSQIAEIDTLKYPELTGFWKEDIELATRLNFRPEIINGIQYQKARLVSYALFPVRAGELIIDEYRSKCTIVGMSALGLSQRQVVTKESEKVPIRVLPLPTENQPRSFTGGVGTYRVQATVDRMRGKANEPLTLKIKVEGQGNAKLIELPPIEYPEGFESYDPRTEASYTPNGRSQKEFEILLIPREPGEYTIAPIEFAFFNPATRSYDTQKTKEIVLSIGPGEGPGLTPSASVDGGGEAGPRAMAPKLPPLSLEYQSGLGFSPVVKIGVWVLIYIATFLVLAWRLVIEFGVGKRKETLKKLVKNRFLKIHAKLSQNDWRAVGVETTNTIYFILGELSGEGASFEMDKLLDKAPPSFRREVAEPLHNLMKKLEVISFAPDAVVGNLKDPAQLKLLVKQTETMLVKALDSDFEIDRPYNERVVTT